MSEAKLNPDGFVITDCNKCAVALSPTCICNLSVDEIVEQWEEMTIDAQIAASNSWDCLVFFCPECDDAGRNEDTYHTCHRYPADHDESGYAGSGTDYEEPIRQFARLVSEMRF